MTGALPSVQERLPCPLAAVDLIVGTSAGSVLAAAAHEPARCPGAGGPGGRGGGGPGAPPWTAPGAGGFCRAGGAPPRPRRRRRGPPRPPPRGGATRRGRAAAVTWTAVCARRP